MSRGGEKAVVAMTIEVLVEVPVHSGEGYHEVIGRAREDLQRRVIEGPTFLPVSFRSERMYANGTTLANMRQALVIPPHQDWFRSR